MKRHLGLLTLLVMLSGVARADYVVTTSVSASATQYCYTGSGYSSCLQRGYDKLMASLKKKCDSKSTYAGDSSLGSFLDYSDGTTLISTGYYKAWFKATARCTYIVRTGGGGGGSGGGR